jgi:hypothetical protein
MTRPFRSVLAAAALLAAWAVMHGCSADPRQGYAFTSSHPTHVQSIAVHIFDNPTHTRDVEVELADALTKELQRTTPYAVVNSGDAQTTLTGTIVDARLRHLTASRRTGLTEEMALDLIVSFEWFDRRTGKPLIRRVDYRTVETFVPARPSNERIELGRHAAVQEMARAIVAEMRSSW